MEKLEFINIEINNAVKGQVECANNYDVVTTSLYNIIKLGKKPTAIILNVSDVDMIESISITIGVISTNRMLTCIKGIPIIETTTIEMGKFMITDFNSFVALCDFKEIIEIIAKKY